MFFRIMPRALAIALAFAGAAMLAACEPNSEIRTEAAGPCHMSSSEVGPGHCERSTLEEHDVVQALPGKPPLETSYLLSLVEFDDEGKARDPRQETLLFDRMAAEAERQDLCIIVFVHGWKHNASSTDTNVTQFQSLLRQVALSELQQDKTQRRKVVGIFAAWRGMSADATPIDENLTFWARKNAAERVADGSIRGLLGKVKAFRDALNAESPSPAPGKPRRSTRMLTIGHSFGGLIVYAALAQYFVDRAATSQIHARYFPMGPATDHPDEKRDSREISGYGDLVIVINPAIEAMRYEPLRELFDTRFADNQVAGRFAPHQTPVLVEVTSVGDSPFEGDWATGLVFPLGRFFNTRFQSTTTDATTGEDEEKQITMAIGHYTPYWTHDLSRPSASATPGARPADNPLIPDIAQECRDFQGFEAMWRDPSGLLKPGWTRRYASGAVLRQTGSDRFDANDPFWVVRAHPEIILDHSDIDEPVFVGFVRQLYDDLNRTKDSRLCPAPGGAP